MAQVEMAPGRLAGTAEVVARKRQAAKVASDRTRWEVAILATVVTANAESVVRAALGVNTAAVAAVAVTSEAAEAEVVAWLTMTLARITGPAGAAAVARLTSREAPNVSRASKAKRRLGTGAYASPGEFAAGLVLTIGVAYTRRSARLRRQRKNGSTAVVLDD